MIDLVALKADLDELAERVDHALDDRPRKGVSLRELADKTNEIYELEGLGLYAPARRRPLPQARGVYGFIAYRHLGFPIASIARHLHMEDSSVRACIWRTEKRTDDYEIRTMLRLLKRFVRSKK